MSSKKIILEIFLQQFSLLQDTNIFIIFINDRFDSGLVYVLSVYRPQSGSFE